MKRLVSVLSTSWAYRARSEAGLCAYAEGLRFMFASTRTPVATAIVAGRVLVCAASTARMMPSMCASNVDWMKPRLLTMYNTYCSRRRFCQCNVTGCFGHWTRAAFE